MQLIKLTENSKRETSKMKAFVESSNVREMNQVGLFSGMPGRILYSKIRYSKNTKIISSGNLDESINSELEFGQHGGIIILSTDVNAVKLSPNRLANWIQQNVDTLKNRLFATKKITKVGTKNDLFGWTIGHYFDGRYNAHDGTSYGENSLSLQMVGVDSQQLLKVAEDICREFEQETVMVKDYNTGKIYFADDK